MKKFHADINDLFKIADLSINNSSQIIKFLDYSPASEFIYTFINKHWSDEYDNFFKKHGHFAASTYMLYVQSMHLLDQGEFDNGICLGMSMFTCTTAVYRENGKDSEIMQFIYPKFKELRESGINNLVNINNKKTQKMFSLALSI